MGHALMDRVCRDWGHLSGNAYKVLLVMASCAMDDADPPIYYGGWERLSLQGLGKRDWPADEDQGDEAVKLRKSRAEIVRKAVAELVKAGAIAVHRRGRIGVRAEYAVTLTQRNVGFMPQRSVGDQQRNVGVEQRNIGANYQHSQHSQTHEQPSPSPVPHQGAHPPVDKARSTDAQLERRRRQADAEAVA